MKKLLCTLLLAGLFAVPLLAQQDDERAKLLQQQAEIQKRLDALKDAKAPAKKADDGNDPAPAQGPFKTGARRTPIANILEAIRTGKAGIHKASATIPASVAMVPPKLSMLGNDRYGDCVTAESCAADEAYSVYLGLSEIVITDAAAIAWAGSHGVLNGADLLSVIQDMEKDGIKDSTGTLRKAGTPSTVNYNDEATLQSAIAVGPVSIAIGSGDLPSGAGNANGWYALTSRGTANDHCVGLWGYGKAEDLYKAIGLPCPSACTGKTGYLLYTWSTIGFVTHAWITGTVQEAWVRTPTVVGLTPVVPPTPITVAIADVVGVVGQPVTFLPLASGGTGPYSFSYAYGDGTTGTTGIYTYAGAGTFAVTVTCTDSLKATGTGTCKAVVGSTPPPPPPPPNGAPSISLSADLAAGNYYLLPQASGNMRLIDIIMQQQPQRSMLTPAERQALQAILDRLQRSKQ